MRNIFYTILLLILLGAGVAQAAEWQDDFLKTYDEFGMTVAVEDALSDDVSSEEILTFIISIVPNMPKIKGLKALYCAGADRDAVREAANKLGITVGDVSVALEESIAECGDKITLSDRDIFDSLVSRLGLSDRDIAPLPEPVAQSEQVTLPDQVTPPTRPRPSSPSVP